MFEPDDNDDLTLSKKDDATPTPAAPGDSLNADAPAAAPVEEKPRLPRLGGRRKGQALLRKSEDRERRPLTAKDRLYLLDAWVKSKLPAGDFAPIVGVSKHSLYAWKKLFAADGPAGLETKARGKTKKSAPVVELTKRAILLLKEANPDYGCERISAILARDEALSASPTTVANVLKEAGYEAASLPTKPHAPRVQRFEREQPNELWQTDLFTFVLKRQNRRVYLVGFMDDSSRFMVGYGLHATQSTSLVLEVFRAGVATYGAPKEVLTDNGSQYVTWRGKSAFSKECERQGIKQIVASPHRPQTLGKVERFWGTLWRECLESAVFVDLEDARRRIGLFIDHYNFRRPHQGINNHVPADRFFGAAPEVRKALNARIAANALDLARHGVPKKPFYLTGQIDGQPFSVHAEGERLFLMRAGGREEVELTRGSKDAGRRILDVVARLGSRTKDRLVTMTSLRWELRDIPHAELDVAILELAQQKLLLLDLLESDGSTLPEQQRKALVWSADGRPALFVGLPHDVQVGETDLPPSVCPDGSPAPGTAEEETGEPAPGTSPLDDALGPPPTDGDAGEESAS